MSSVANQCVFRKRLINQFFKSIIAVHPSRLIIENLKIEKDDLHICHKVFHLTGKDIYLVGFGKAALGMAAECERILGQHLKSGVICCPHNSQFNLRNNPAFTLKKNSVIQVHEGAKDNLPDEDAEKGTNEIISLVKSLDSAKDHLIVLISGGGSALFTKPKPGILLAEKMETIKLLMESGADIKELNTVRKKLSLVKGGGLAYLSHPVRTTCLIISDVIDDPLDVIASGPTVPSFDSDSAAFSVIKKYNLENKVPVKVLEEIKKVSQKSGISVLDKNFSHVDNFLIGNNSKVLEASKKYAEESGFKSIILSSQVKGEVQYVSNFYANMIFQILLAYNTKGKVLQGVELFRGCCFNTSSRILEKLNDVIQNLKNICIIAGGETTVEVKGDGKGGRNQELALTTSVKVDNLRTNHPYLFNKYEVVFLFAGTDGIDGPTDAAGALGGSFIVDKAKKNNLNINQFLLRNDSYTFFSMIDDGSYLIKTGHTGTNVMDIHIILIYQKPSLENNTNNEY